MGLKFEECLEKEVFIVCSDEDVDEDMFIAKNWMELLGYLRKLDVLPVLRVFHGIITTAEILPQSFRNKSVYLLCSQNQFATGFIVEMDTLSSDELANEIEAIIGASPYQSTDEGIPLTIDNIFIFYGYELPMYFSVSQEQIDDEVINTCETIIQNINKIRKKQTNKIGYL